MATYNTSVNIGKVGNSTSTNDVEINVDPDLKEISVIPNNFEEKDEKKKEKPKVLKKDIFYVNNDWSCIYLNMANPEDWDIIDSWTGRLRRIIDGRGIFRCEDLDIIMWNSKSFVKNCISGSTYVRDGNLELFQKSIKEIETKVASYR